MNPTAVRSLREASSSWRRPSASIASQGLAAVALSLWAASAPRRRTCAMSNAGRSTPREPRSSSAADRKVVGCATDRLRWSRLLTGQATSSSNWRIWDGLAEASCRGGPAAALKRWPRCPPCHCRYRARFGQKSDYPMSTPGMSEKRREVTKAPSGNAVAKCAGLEQFWVGPAGQLRPNFGRSRASARDPKAVVRSSLQSMMI